MSKGKLNTFKFDLKVDNEIREITKLMAYKMAECFAQQRGREYGFGPKAGLNRATNLYTLSPDLIKFERDLSMMDRKYKRSGCTQTTETNSKCKCHL